MHATSDVRMKASPSNTLMEGVHHKRANVSTHISYRRNVSTAVCMATYVRHYPKVRRGGGVLIVVSPCTLAAPVAASSLDSTLSTDGLAEGDKSDCHR